ncbi:MAG: serine/threonine protein kinase [Myxococcales bacterium]|nr:serine/threonine protein kinase [Myxococcales bacterium]
MDIETLIALGKYAEAANEARRLGDLGRAQQLYERIWDFRSAADVARERGDRPDLLRLLIDAKDYAEAGRVGESMHAAAPPEQERAAEVYERRRMFAEAAALRERLGQLERARDLYKKGQLPLDVARLDEAAGRVRDAGITLERFLADGPDASEAARAQFALGRILAGFGRHEESVRNLQKAIGAAESLSAVLDAASIPPPLDASSLSRARRLLIVELAALGYREAARALLDPLRAADSRLPPLDAFLAAEQRSFAADSAERLGGRYRVNRLLGSGGMGRVYLARDEFSGRDVAVKVVAAPVDTRSGDGYRRFLREAEIVSSLHHPNIVAVVAAHEELGLLAMEFMAGGTLADRLNAPQSPTAVRAWALDAVSGLEAAHAHGVIHRDLKPANIFFSASGEAKLGDFGVAHLVDLGATQTAGFIGTLAYMAPEQISGAPLTFAADVYALGVTLFQALTGRLPFRGPDFVGQHLGEAAPAPSSIRPELHPAWDALVARTLEKAPADRFASLDELRRGLVAIPVEPPAARAAVVAVEATTEEAPAAERYVITAELEGGLVQATDTRLGREVVIELLPADAPHLAWLRALAKWAGARLQRVLRLERLTDGSVRVVYEALAGKTPRPPRLSVAEHALLVRALAPLHAAGVAHGSVATSIVLEDHGPALLTAGRRPSPTSIEDELSALGELVAR